MPKNVFSGACHCGNLVVELEATRPAAELPVRTCGCTFCARHQPRYTSDPQGQLRFRMRDETKLSRYRFGLRLADFLICRECGVFVGAFEPGAASTTGRAVVNFNVFGATAAQFTAASTRMDYDTEDAAARTARRAKAWTPATLSPERVG